MNKHGVCLPSTVRAPWAGGRAKTSLRAGSASATGRSYERGGLGGRRW